MAAETTSLRALLAIPEVGRTLTSSLVGRLPYAAIGLLLILRVRELGGDYADGGVAAGAFALGLACMAPFIGRLVDVHGQAAVLVPTAFACAVPLGAIALVPDTTPVAVVAGLAALAGMTFPPLSGAMRALWPELVPPARRHAIFALESAGLELTFILGPLLLVGALAALTSPGLGLVACAGLILAGTLAFASAPSSRRWRPSGAPRTLAGALASPALLTLMLAVACAGASFGAIEVATAAAAEEGAVRRSSARSSRRGRSAAWSAACSPPAAGRPPTRAAASPRCSQPPRWPTSWSRSPRAFRRWGWRSSSRARSSPPPSRRSTRWCRTSRAREHSRSRTRGSRPASPEGPPPARRPAARSSRRSRPHAAMGGAAVMVGLAALVVAAGRRLLAPDRRPMSFGAPAGRRA